MQKVTTNKSAIQAHHGRLAGAAIGAASNATKIANRVRPPSNQMRISLDLGHRLAPPIMPVAEARAGLLVLGSAAPRPRSGGKASSAVSFTGCSDFCMSAWAPLEVLAIRPPGCHRSAAPPPSRRASLCRTGCPNTFQYMNIVMLFELWSTRGRSSLIYVNSPASARLGRQRSCNSVGGMVYAATPRFVEQYQ